jgi:predicted branched-subunit amino acid permease
MQFFRAAMRHPQFQVGAKEMVGVSLGVAAWGLVTGVAMVKTGLSVPLALLMSLVVFAGSAQLAAIPLMAMNAPMWVIWATALCVNLRFVIFSAQWRPFFMQFTRSRRVLLGYFTGDLTYVLFMKRFSEAREGVGQFEYFLGGTSVNWAAWQSPSIAGFLLADVIPSMRGLGFAGVLALLGMTYSMLSDRSTAFAAVVAGAAAVAAFALPFHLHIVVAIAAAICVGLMFDGGGDAGRRIRNVLAGIAPRLKAEAGTREARAT